MNTADTIARLIEQTPQANYVRWAQFREQVLVTTLLDRYYDTARIDVLLNLSVRNHTANAANFAIRRIVSHIHEETGVPETRIREYLNAIYWHPKTIKQFVVLHDPAVVAQFPTDAICPICLTNAPCLMTKCGHRFCNCLLEYLGHAQKPCPLCRENIFEITSAHPVSPTV